jgi:arylsulfatase A-like enzyme
MKPRASVVNVWQASVLGLVLTASVIVIVASHAQSAEGQLRSVQAQPMARPNVILIVADAVRADHVSAYGYARSTTPNLDTQIAAQGVRFAETSAAAGWTLPSNVAMLTGQSPARFGVAWSAVDAALPNSATLLSEYLQQAGYHTAGFVAANYLQSKYGLAQGYDTYSVTVRSDPGSPRAGEVNQLITTWLDHEWLAISSTQPLFMLVYDFDPHAWYDPPPPFDTLYDPTYTGTITPAVFGNGRSVVDGSLVVTPRDVEHVKALYDGEIAYWDQELGVLLNSLASRHVLDNAVIIVTSDHGQQFGEHGLWLHHNSVYEEALRIPLLVRYTGVVSPGLVITSPVQNLDITPSILDWLGLSVPPNLDGQSFVTLTQGSLPLGPRALFSEQDAVTDPTWGNYWIAPRYELRAVRWGDWKYIHYDGRRGADELYELQAASQYEITNSIALRPDIAATLQQALQQHYRLRDIYLNLPLTAR